MIVIFTICGILLGFLIGYQTGKPKEKKIVKEKYSRRGLYKNDYSISNNGVKSTDITVTFEVGEIESTDTLSKVEVISIKTNRSEFNKNDSEQEKLKVMIDNSWIESKDIQWITTIAQIRNDKIDQILG